MMNHPDPGMDLSSVVMDHKCPGMIGPHVVIGRDQGKSQGAAVMTGQSLGTGWMTVAISTRGLKIHLVETAVMSSLGQEMTSGAVVMNGQALGTEVGIVVKTRRGSGSRLMDVVTSP